MEGGKPQKPLQPEEREAELKRQAEETSKFGSQGG